MRFCGRSLRWLLPERLIPSPTAQIGAQDAAKPTAVDTAALIKQAESGDAKSQ
jgi:hypothetical protein